MPYVTFRNRQLLDSGIPASDPGELNYLFTKVLLKYLNKKGLSYQTINDIMGALDGAGKEFYRRVAIPYEDGKIEANGDVYEY